MSISMTAYARCRPGQMRGCMCFACASVCAFVWDICLFAVLFACAHIDVLLRIRARARACVCVCVCVCVCARACMQFVTVLHPVIRTLSM